jgi:tRNA-specific 2-thiouridylase
MKVAALISGGVDSSVSLRLLKERGYDVTAFYLKVWLEDELEYLGQCPWEEDLEYVHEVCDSLSVPVEVLPVQQDYRERVIRYAIAEVEQGRTPNPDILCNSRIKFGCFYERIERDYEKVATGHYANVRETRAGGATVYQLATAPDPIKDQTYFLSHLDQSQLSRAIFPIGEYRKEEVRELAQRFALANKDRKDSQGLCFLGKISFREFIKHHLGERPGDIVDLESGERMGEHRGYWFHTIGQRQGLGLSGGPWYVVKKDVASNTIYISRDYFSEEKLRDAFEVGNPHWISNEPPRSRELRVKLRHGESFYRCQIEAAGPQRLRVRIDGRDQGIAAGQFAVFYDSPEGADDAAGAICLGGGVIL